MRTHWFRETSPSEGRELKERNVIEERRNLKEVSPNIELSSAEISSKAYDETIKGIIAEYGSYISEEQKVRIDIESELSNPTVMTSEEYCERFPGSDPNVLGHYDAEGRIYMKEGSSETLTHVATHEAMHLTSFNEFNDDNLGLRTYRSGIRETIYGEAGLQQDHNRALNEGITELYAIREMQRRGDMQSIDAVSAYPESRKAASELQDIVGYERIREAYFGGDTEQLKKEVIRLSYDDETAWERFSKNVDIIEYGTDYEQIQVARQELTLQNATMLSFKESEALKACEGQ